MKKIVLAAMMAGFLLCGCGEKGVDIAATESTPVIENAVETVKDSSNTGETVEEGIIDEEIGEMEPTSFEDKLRYSILGYFTEMYQPEGNYVIFDNEDVETDEEISFIVRYQPSEAEEEKMIAEGTGPVANKYVVTVIYDKRDMYARVESGEIIPIDLSFIDERLGSLIGTWEFERAEFEFDGQYGYYLEKGEEDITSTAVVDGNGNIDFSFYHTDSNRNISDISNYGDFFFYDEEYLPGYLNLPWYLVITSDNPSKYSLTGSLTEDGNLFIKMEEYLEDNHYNCTLIWYTRADDDFEPTEGAPYAEEGRFIDEEPIADLDIAGRYSGIINGDCEISMYTDVEEYAVEVGNIIIYDQDAHVLYEDVLNKVMDNMYEIGTSGASISVYTDNGNIGLDFYVDGKNADYFIMVEHYES